MVTVDLVPGNHTISMTLAGYSQLNAVINVSSTGVVTCVSVAGGNCNSSYTPGMQVSGMTVVGYLAPISTSTPTPTPTKTPTPTATPTPTSNICNWITNIGGRSVISAFHIMSLVSAYSGSQNLGFNVTASHIMGAVAYYSGNVSSGNALTGCAFV